MENQTDVTAAESAPGLGSLADTATGRDLDALVAEHVMGWTDFRGYCGHATGRPPNGDQWGFIPHYSTDHNAAALVLNHELTEYDWRIRNMIGPGMDPVGDVWVVDCKAVGERICTRVENKSLPEAICRAALKAREIEQVNKD